MLFAFDEQELYSHFPAMRIWIAQTKTNRRVGKYFTLSKVVKQLWSCIVYTQTYVIVLCCVPMLYIQSLHICVYGKRIVVVFILQSTHCDWTIIYFCCDYEISEVVFTNKLKSICTSWRERRREEGGRMRSASVLLTSCAKPFSIQHLSEIKYFWKFVLWMLNWITPNIIKAWAEHNRD